MHEQRRCFLKMTAVGVTGLALGRGKPAWAAWPASGTLEINPSISNLRVVACKDAAMMKSTPTSQAFATQNAAVDAARVQANMDAMAMQLANAATADAAWKAIFRSSKPWASTLVAIKVNATESKNMPRVAVIEKFCRVLAGLGVPASNLIIYDAPPSNFTSAIASYASYFSASDPSKIPGVVSNVNDALGGTTNAQLPNGTSVVCTADIAKGKVDILINIAVNKGHPYFGRATLCMKNHFGTFAPNHNDIANYITNLNKSEAIIGGSPVRQQLCFIDSLIANKASNSGTPEAMPYYLVMGTFAPAVDYLTVKKIREEALGCTQDDAVIDSYVTSFGYTTSDPQWVLVPPATATTDGGMGGAGGSGSGGRTGTTSSGGTNGAGGTKGAGGAGGARSSAGTGGGGSGGAQGAGGASAGGMQASGGIGSGGAQGSGGASTGGTRGSGGTSGSGGSSAGGTQGSGGAESGGASGSGGAGGSGSGGTSTSSASANGGAQASGGTTGGGRTESGLGCGCRVAARQGSAGLGVALAASAFIVGQLRWLCTRRHAFAQTRSARDEPCTGAPVDDSDG